MENNYDARDALRDVEAQRQHLAGRVVTPWWYHPAVGAGVAMLCMACANFLNTPVYWILLIAALAVMVVAMRVYRGITGLWVNWKDAGPAARKLGSAYAVVVVVCVGLSAAIGIIWSPLLALPVALVSAVVTVILGRKLDDRIREGIRDGSAGLL